MRAHPFAPAHHAAPVRAPGRRTWLVIGLLVALTVLPTLVVILAGRSVVRGPSMPNVPYQADGPGAPVIVEPDGGGPRPPRAGAPAVPAPLPPRDRGVGGGGGREESGAVPCPEPGGPDTTPAPGGGAGNPAPPAGDETTPAPAPSNPQPSVPAASPSAGEPRPSAPGARFRERVFGELGLP